MLDLQSSAPMEAAPDVQPVQVTGFTEPTQRPNEPVTSGIASGPGPGPEALSNRQQPLALTQVLKTMLPADSSGEVAAFFDLAQRNGW
jgi:hypothetical protein